METTETTNTNANTQVAVVMPGSFDKINYDQLSAVMDKLGKHSSQMSKEEKELACQAIDQWEKTVVQSIHDRRGDAQRYLDMLAYKNGCEIDEDFLEQICVSCGMSAQFLDWQNAMDQAVLYEKTEKPSQYAEALDDTVEDVITARQNHDKQLQVYRINLNKLEQTAANKLQKLLKDISTRSEIKELVSRLKAYTRNAKRFQDECQNKAQIAKINVNINVPEAREALLQLLKFQATI